MNSPCGNEDLLMADPYGVMKEGKGGGNSIGIKDSCPFQRIQGPVLLPPTHRSALEPETKVLGKLLYGAQDSHQKGKGSETVAAVSLPSTEEDPCIKSEDPKETASALTAIAVPTSCHTGNRPGAPELKTQLYSWTYKSSALKGSNRLASLEVRHRGKHVKTPWSQGYIIIKNSEILLIQFPWVK